jgi:hypothetical protein
MIYSVLTNNLSGSAYSGTFDPQISTLKNGDVFVVNFHAACGKGPTLNVLNKVLSIKNRTSKPILMGDIKKDMVLTLSYNQADNSLLISENIATGKRLQDIDKKNTAHPESIIYSHDTNEFANGDKTKSDFTMKMHELAGDIISSNYFVHNKAGLDIVVGDPRIKGFVLKDRYRIVILFKALPKANFSIKLHDSPLIPGGNESFQNLITIDSHCEFEYDKTANKWFLMRDSLYLLRNGATPMTGDLDMGGKTIKNSKIDKPEINGGKAIGTLAELQSGDGIDNCSGIVPHIYLGKPISSFRWYYTTDKKKYMERLVFDTGTMVDRWIDWSSTQKILNTVTYDVEKKKIFSFNGKELATQEYVDARVLQIGMYVHADWATAKTGWMYADGRTLPPSYAEYYKEYPDGKVLDPRGRFLMADQAGVYGRRSIGGSGTASLTEANNAPHLHAYWALSVPGNSAWSHQSSGTWRHDDYNRQSNTSASGSGSAFSTRNPYLVLPVYVFVGLNTSQARFKANVEDLKDVTPDIVRKTKAKNNGIRKFEYLNGNVMFTFDDKKEMLFREQEVNKLLKLEDILEELKQEELLCTLYYNTEDVARAYLTNHMIKRINLFDIETVQIQLKYSFQDRIQEALNQTSYDELKEIRMQIEQEEDAVRDKAVQDALQKWQQENPLEYLKSQKIEELNSSVLLKVSARTFSESQSILQKKNELIDYISMQNDIQTLQTLNISEVINQK